MNIVTEIQTKTNDGDTPIYNESNFADAFRQFLLGNAYKLMFTIKDNENNLSSLTFRQENGKFIVYGSNLQHIQTFIEYSCEVSGRLDLLDKLKGSK